MPNNDANSEILHSSSERAFIYVRNEGQLVCVAVSEEENGDAEICLTQTDCRKLLIILEKAISAIADIPADMLE